VDFLAAWCPLEISPPPREAGLLTTGELPARIHRPKLSATRAWVEEILMIQ